MATPSEVRVHHAARLIAYHCSTGANGGYKNFLPPIIDCAVTHNYWGTADLLKAEWAWEVLKGAFQTWNIERLAHFYAYPIVSLLAKHSVEEQREIAHILRDVYDFQF